MAEERLGRARGRHLQPFWGSYRGSIRVWLRRAARDPSAVELQRLDLSVAAVHGQER